MQVEGIAGAALLERVENVQAVVLIEAEAIADLIAARLVTVLFVARDRCSRAFLLFLGIQAFALALGLLSPSIHAARLHFVEWMGKFHNGTGVPFRPLGGRAIHVEGA